MKHLLLILLCLVTFPAQAADLWRFDYQGAFRLPPDTVNGSSFGYGGGCFAVSPHGTLWVEGHTHHQLVAEVTIPEPVEDDVTANLPEAKIVTPFTDITKGKIDSELGGLTFDRTLNRWWFTLEQFYDVSPTVYPTIGWTTADLAEAHGPWMTDVGNKLTERYITLAPRAWADEHLGGRFLLTGQAGVSGTTGSSQGPSITAVEPPTDPGQLLSTKILSFHEDTDEGRFKHPDGSPWNRTDTAISMTWVDGYVLITGVVGTGTQWYGTPDNPPETGIPDRWKRGKGYHAPPYEERLWIYAADDLEKVARGDLAPGAIYPVETIDLRPHLYRPGHVWVSAAYDETTRRLYLCEPKGHDRRYSDVPVIHVYALTEAPPPVDPCEELKQQVAELTARCEELTATIARLHAKIAAAREALQ